jgi:hypothetical protein
MLAFQLVFPSVPVPVPVVQLKLIVRKKFMEDKITCKEIDTVNLKQD